MAGPVVGAIVMQTSQATRPAPALHDGMLGRILFVSLTNDVGSDRIVAECGRQGAACAVLGPADCFASLPRTVAARFAWPAALGTWAATLALKRHLAKAAVRWGADAVVPLDELTALTLRTMATARGTPADLRALLVRSLGRPDGYGASCHRVPLMVAAASLGIRTPAFQAVSVGTAASLPFPLLVKRDHSSGSGGVSVVLDPAALAVALRRATLKTRIKAGMARAAGYHHGDSAILLQSFVPGTLAMYTVACRNGAVLDGIGFLAATIHPTKGASTVLRPIDNAEMADAARRLVASLGCTGFVSFDFIVTPSGDTFLIEMNPRPIGSVHLGRLFGHDLCGAFLAGHPIALAPSLGPDQAVALFPKELERDPASRAVERGSGVFHDVPREDPAVLAAYLRHLARVHPAHAAEIRDRLGTPIVELASPPWHAPARSEVCS